MTVSLVAGGVWWAQGEEPGGAVEAARPGSPAASPTSPAMDRTDARGAAQQPPRGTGVSVPRRPDVWPHTDTSAARPHTGESAPRRPGAPPRTGESAPRRPGAPPRTGESAPRRPGVPPRTGEPAPRRPAVSRRPPKAVPPSSSAPRQRTLPRSRATRLVIDYLDVDAPVMSLRLDRERRLPAPPDDDANRVGWYEGGPSPGQQGTAVAVGHLDTGNGPAVFAGLSELRRGRLVEVTRADGRIAVYSVDTIKSYEKDRFPNREVYGNRGRPELRLITCGGDYNRRTGYSGNLVVFAHLVETREPPARTVRR
ncbi:class F sortase [Streptomyces sp. NPDC001536]|uniref:class F sortase n=1 Tax=Streptomyces sp. NPDC001536 TaxID=3364583 RepID=UPI0036B2B411